MYLTDAFGSEHTVTLSEHTVKLFRITNVMWVKTSVNTFTAAYGSSANVCTGFTSNYMLLGRDAYRTFEPYQFTDEKDTEILCHDRLPPCTGNRPALTLTSGRK